MHISCMVCKDNLCIAPQRGGLHNLGMKVFSERLKRLLADRDVPHAELARRLGDMRPERVNHWLNGRMSEPSYTILLEICEILETHPNYLLGASDRVEPTYHDAVSKIRTLEAEVRELKRLVAAPRKI